MMTIFKWVMLAGFTLLAMIMAATVVLVPFIPLVLLVIYYYATGYEYGHLGHLLAHKINKREEELKASQSI